MLRQNLPALMSPRKKAICGLGCWGFPPLWLFFNHKQKFSLIRKAPGARPAASALIAARTVTSGEQTPALPAQPTSGELIPSPLSQTANQSSAKAGAPQQHRATLPSAALLHQSPALHLHRNGEKTPGLKIMPHAHRCRATSPRARATAGCSGAVEGQR